MDLGSSGPKTRFEITWFFQEISNKRQATSNEQQAASNKQKGKNVRNFYSFY